MALRAQASTGAEPLRGARRPYPFVGLLVAVGVERGQDVNPGLLHQADDARVPGQVLLTQELQEQEQQLAAQHLVAVGPCDVVELGFTWTQRWGEDRCLSGAWSATALIALR